LITSNDVLQQHFFETSPPSSHSTILINYFGFVAYNFPWGINPYKWIPVNEVEAALFGLGVFGGAGAHVSPHDGEDDGAKQRVLDRAREQVGADVFEEIAHDVGAVALLRHHAFVQQVDLLLVPRRVLKRRRVVARVV
jgi:hypothetical protein